MLRSSGERQNHFLVPDVSGKALSFSPCDVSYRFCVDSVYQVPFILSLLGFFHEWVLDFVNKIHLSIR